VGTLAPYEDVLQTLRLNLIGWTVTRNRPALFRGRHFEDVIILRCVRSYLRYSLRYRDLEEMMAERGFSLDDVTIWRWVQHYAPILNQRLRREVRHPNRSWQVDETYVRVAGKWAYLYRRGFGPAQKSRPPVLGSETLRSRAIARDRHVARDPASANRNGGCRTSALLALRYASPAPAKSCTPQLLRQPHVRVPRLTPCDTRKGGKTDHGWPFRMRRGDKPSKNRAPWPAQESTRLGQFFRKYSMRPTAVGCSQKDGDCSESPWPAQCSEPG
jgi:hypothetical protein